MQQFRSAGVDIAFEVMGEGPPILLIHGFASNSRVNWVSTGWVKQLNDAGRQVILIDNRGHGQSAKLYDPQQYPADLMARDAVNLLDHLNIDAADIMGYSMGARITAFIAINHPGKIKSAVLGGLAENIFRGVGRGEAIAEGLEAAVMGDITDPTARAFRLFAEHTKSDLRALAACMRAGRPAITAEALAKITIPVLVVAGDLDDIAGSIDPLVRAIPSAKGVLLEGRDHMKAVGDLTYKREVVEFLK